MTSAAPSWVGLHLREPSDRAPATTQAVGSDKPHTLATEPDPPHATACPVTRLSWGKARRASPRRRWDKARQRWYRIGARPTVAQPVSRWTVAPPRLPRTREPPGRVTATCPVPTRQSAGNQAPP